MTSPPSCKKAGVGAGLDRRYIQPYVFRYAHAVYYSKTGPFCQDFDRTNYPVCLLTNRTDSGVIRIKRAYRMAVTPDNLTIFEIAALCGSEAAISLLYCEYDSYCCFAESHYK